MDRDASSYPRLVPAPSNLLLNPVRDVTFTASLGTLCHGLTTLPRKNFLLIPNLNLPLFHLKPFPLSCHPMLSPQFLSSSLGVLSDTERCCKVYPELSLLQAEQPQLSAWLQSRGVPALRSSLCPPLDLLLWLHVLLKLGAQSWTQNSRLGLTMAEKREKSLFLFCSEKPGASILAQDILLEPRNIHFPGFETWKPEHTDL